MKNGNKTVELVGKSKEIVLRHGHKFLVKPGFLIIKEHRNTYAVTFINDFSARFYQGTTGGIIRVDIDPREFARRFNIAENFMWETIVPKMRERIWEWGSEDAVLDESMALAIDCVKKYSTEALCDKTEYLILDSVDSVGEEHLSWFVKGDAPGVYEHRTIPAVFNTVAAYDCEGFVVLTKTRLAELREAEARLYAEMLEAEAACEISINIDYGDMFKEEPSSEGFRYKNPESFDDVELNVPYWRKPVEKLPPHWWRETRDDDTEE